MKKLFISQPMRGKTPAEILEERRHMIFQAEKLFPDGIEVLDTYYKDFDGNRVEFLGRSIGDLGKADVAIFAPGWENFTGCRCEHTVCQEYDIPHIHALPAGMTQEREAAILEGAISKFGPGAQIIKAIEELGELTVELARHMNDLGTVDAVREEMADAFIMLNQMELIFGDVTEIEVDKLERLERLIGDVSV